MGSWMQWAVIVSLLFVFSCSGVNQYTLTLDDREIRVIMCTNKSPIGGTDLRTIQVWHRDPKTKEWKHLKAESSSTEGKSIIDALKGLPIPVLMP